jgi:hypothetical protein
MKVGADVGAMVGKTIVGAAVGAVGAGVGAAVGAAVGEAVGAAVGTWVSPMMVGAAVGAAVGAVGAAVGAVHAVNNCVAEAPLEKVYGPATTASPPGIFSVTVAPYQPLYSLSMWKVCSPYPNDISIGLADQPYVSPSSMRQVKALGKYVQ